MNSSIINIKQILFCLIALVLFSCTLVLFSCTLKSADNINNKMQSNNVVTDLMLISFNLRYINNIDVEHSWDNRKEAVIRMINKENPDVIGFQEPREVQASYLIERMTNYACHYIKRSDFMADEKGIEPNMIFFKKDKYDLIDKGQFWLSETPEVPSKGWDAAQRRSAVWVKLKDKKTSEVFYYFCTHFDHKGSNARYQSSKLFVRMIPQIADNNEPVFLSADFNARVPSDALMPLTKYMNLSREHASVTDNYPTFNKFGNGAAADAIIDHIFYRNATPLVYKTLNGNYGVPYISDHYPIMTKFEF